MKCYPNKEKHEAVKKLKNTGIELTSHHEYGIGRPVSDRDTKCAVVALMLRA